MANNENLDRIEVGDYVRVSFNHSQMTLCLIAEVLYIPCASGDSWIFRDFDSNTAQLHYVSEGCTLTLIRKGTKTS